MESFFNELIGRLERDLAKNHYTKDVLKRICLDKECIASALRELLQNQDFYLDYTVWLRNTVQFNKKLLPPVLAKLLLLRFQFELEREKKFSTKEIFKTWCEVQLGKVRGFFVRYGYFYDYYQSDKTEDDEEFFCGNGMGYYPYESIMSIGVPVELTNTVSREFYNPGLLLIAGIIAYDQYAQLLKRELEEEKQFNQNHVNWDKKVVDLAEQVVGQYEYKTTLVHGEPATLDYLIKEATHIYANINEKQLSAAIREITKRGKGPTEHHKKIILSLERRDTRLATGRKERKPRF